MPFIDLATNCSVAQLLKPQLVAGDIATTTPIDTRGYGYALIIMNCGVMAGDGQVQVYVNADSASDFTPASGNRITGAAFTLFDAAPSTAMNMVEYGGVNLSGVARYLNVELDYTGTGDASNDGDLGITVVLIPDDTNAVPVSSQTFRTSLKFDLLP